MPGFTVEEQVTLCVQVRRLSLAIEYGNSRRDANAPIYSGVTYMTTLVCRSTRSLSISSRRSEHLLMHAQLESVVEGGTLGWLALSRQPSKSGIMKNLSHMIHLMTGDLLVHALPHDGFNFLNKVPGHWFIHFVRSSLGNFSIE